MSLPKKANFGCGPAPLYSQDKEYMKVRTEEDLDEWLLVDLFIKHPQIKNWDIEKLDEIPDNYLEEIFSSHALEHISHRKVIDVLKLWYQKLVLGGKITIIVPDLMYALEQLRGISNGHTMTGLYKDAFGLHSPLSIIYGTHSQEGEYHLGGFTEDLFHWALAAADFENIQTKVKYDNHQMNSILATAQKL